VYGVVSHLYFSKKKNCKKKEKNMASKVVANQDPKILALTTPPKDKKFMKREVEKLLEEILQREFAEKKYVYEEAMTWAKDISQEIQRRVSEKPYERYKTVVQVTLTEAAGQGIRVASRCLWDPEVDNFAEVTMSTEYIHVIALVFGLYWE